MKIFQRGGETSLAEGFSTAMLEAFNVILYFTVCKGYVHSNYGDLCQLEETPPPLQLCIVQETEVERADSHRFLSLHLT